MEQWEQTSGWKVTDLSKMTVKQWVALLHRVGFYNIIIHSNMFSLLHLFSGLPGNNSAHPTAVQSLHAWVLFSLCGVVFLLFCISPSQLCAGWTAQDVVQCVMNTNESWNFCCSARRRACRRNMLPLILSCGIIDEALCRHLEVHPPLWCAMFAQL